MRNNQKINIEKLKKFISTARAQKFSALFFLFFLFIFLSLSLRIFLNSQPPYENKTDQQYPKTDSFDSTYYQNQDRTIRVSISHLSNEYYQSGYIPLTEDEPNFIKFDSVNAPSDLSVEIYQLDIEKVLDAFIYKYEKESNYPEIVGIKDVSNLKLLVKTDFSKLDDYKTDDKSNSIYTYKKIELPQNDTNIYFVRAVSSKDIHAGSIVSRSNIAVLSKNMNTELLFWGKDLSTGDVLAGGKITVYSLKNSKSVISTGTFDENGIVKTQLKNDSDIAVVQIKNKYAILPLNVTTRSEYYKRFDTQNSTIRSYIYTDKPLYKPGDEVKFKAIIKDDDDTKLTSYNQPITVTAYGYKNNETFTFYNKKITPSANGTITDTINIPIDINTGNAYLNITDSRNNDIYIDSTLFNIENYRKPEYELKVDFDKNIYLNGEEISFTVDGKYFSGQPIINGSAKYKIRRGEIYKGEFYQNSELDYYWYGGADVIDEGSISFDATGKAKLSKKIDFAGGQTSKNFSLQVEVTYDDGSGNPAYSVGKAKGYTARYLFYRSLDGENNDYYQKGNTYNRKFIVIDVLNEKPAMNVSVDTKLNLRMTTDDKLYGSKTEEKELYRKSYKTDQNGEFIAELNFSEQGSNYLTVSILDDQRNEISENFSFYVSLPEKAASSIIKGDGSSIELMLDKETYNIGDIANIKVTSPIKDLKAILTVERSRVHDYYPLELKDGFGNISIPVVEKFNPNIYVAATSFSGNQLISSEKELNINEQTKKLNIKIISDKEKYKVGDEVSIEIFTSDKDGKPVSSEVGVWAIDKALLELSLEYFGNPYLSFWNKRYNGTSTAHSYESIYGDMAERGGGGGEGSESDPRFLFKDTALWRSAVQTNKSGYANVKFRLPDNLTTWAVRAVGFTEDNKFGLGTSELLVSKDVIVRPFLPNFIRTTDEMIVSALVQNFSGLDSEFDVTANYTAGTLIPQFNKQDLFIPNNQSRTYKWKLIPDKDDENAKITFSAKPKDEDIESDSVILDFPSILFGYKTSNSKSLYDGGSIKFLLNEDNFNSKTKIKLYSYSDLLGSLIPASKYLIDYPYGCIEQTTSRLIPTIIASENKELFKDIIKDKDLTAMVKEGMKRLKDLQNPNGGWSWYAGSTADPSLSAYVFSYLVEAKKEGYEIDIDVYSKAKTYFVELLESKNKLQIDLATYALSLDRYFKLYPRAILDVNGYSTDYLSMFLISNLENDQTDPDKNGMNELISRAIQFGNDQVYWSAEKIDHKYITDTSLTAMTLYALMKAGADDVLITKGMNYLSKNNGKSYYWGNTFASAQVMKAVSEYAKRKNYLDTKYTYRTLLNGKEILNGKVSNSNKNTKVYEINLSDLNRQGENEILVEKNGIGDLHTVLVMDLYNTNKNSSKTNNGIDIERAYLSKNGIDKTIAVGDIVDVYVKSSKLDTSNYIVISDLLPSGFVPVNENLQNESMNVESDYYGYRWFNNNIQYKKDGADYYHDYYFGNSNSSSILYHYKARAISAGRFSIPPVYSEYMYTPEVNGYSATQNVIVTESPSNLVDKSSLPGTEGFLQEIINQQNQSNNNVAIKKEKEIVPVQILSRPKKDSDKKMAILLLMLMVQIIILIYIRNRRSQKDAK